MNKWKRGKYLITVVVFIFAIFSVGAARADLIYSTMGPSFSWSNSHALVFGTYDEGPPPLHSVTANYGFAFTPSYDAILDYIYVPVANYSGSNSLKLSLMSDSAGVPGTIQLYATFNVSDIGTLYTADATALNFALTAGTKYWVVLEAQGDGQFGWYENNALTGPTAAKQYAGSGWNTVSLTNPTYFAVEGTPAPSAVPIPPAVWLLGSGLIGLIGIRRRFRK